MAASLYVEVPALAPSEVVLDAEVVSVGRAESNLLALRDMNVSRHHFSLQLREGVGWVLQDHGSRNGTVVNGVSVLNKVLLEGDRIQVGGSRLTFRAQASPTAVSLRSLSRPSAAQSTASAFGFSPAPVHPTFTRRATMRSTPQDALPRPASPPPELTPAPPGIQLTQEPGTRPDGVRRGDARWRKLAEVAYAINLERDHDRLLETILDAVLTLVPAKSAFLVLCEAGAAAAPKLAVKTHRNAPGALKEGTEENRLSRQVCRDAIAKKRPVLTQDAVSDDDLSSFLTVVNLQLKSILCVPFSHMGEVLGVVYLDEPQAEAFDDDGEAVELVGAFGDLAGIALANARLLQEVAERERLEEELRIAARMQRSLLPSRPPTVRGLELAGRTTPARGVGGDIYDFFRRESPAKDVLISIGDVAGKGVGAGLVMASVHTLLHAYAEVHRRTDELLVHLNRVLSPDLDDGVFVSYLLIRYDEESGVLHYTGAGHEHLILFRPSTGQLEFIRAGGVVLGLVSDMQGRITERKMTLKPGDVVCLYTDGATEAQGPDGAEFGLERLAETMRSGPLDPASVVDRCMKAVVQHTGEGRDLHDDLTVVALRKR